MSLAAASPVRSPQHQITAYFGLLTLTFGVVGQLAALPVQFYLKDRLHLGPQTVALFGFLTGIPTYVAFLFGYLRDRWRPRTGGDRAYLLGAGMLSVLGYLSLADGNITYARLLALMLVLTGLGQMILAVIQAVSTAVAQRDHTTGRLSAVLNVGTLAPSAIASLAGGWLSEHVTPRHTFLLVAALTTLVALLALWRPRSVYEDLPEQSRTHGGLRAAARLVRHRPIWPAVLIYGMWNVGLCFGTPLQYYLTDRAHMSPPLSPEQYGTWLAIFGIAFLPTTVLYGFVSRYWPLHRSLWAGTSLAVFQMLPLLLMHTPAAAYGAAAAVGLCGGFATAAYFDLLMRSAPRGLEGTALMLGGAAFAAFAAGSSLLGASVYAHGGFALSVWLTCGVYALIFPVLLWVPRAVTATHDEEEQPEGAEQERSGSQDHRLA